MSPMRTNPSTTSTINKWGGLLLLAALFAMLLWFGSVAITLTVLVVIFILAAHEFGHYITARLTGMKVSETFIGFGPRLWSFRRGETEYGVRLLPLGAYVRIIGMTSTEEVAPADERRTYRDKSFPRRALVVSAGSLMHLLMAFLALLSVYAFTGTPTRSDLTIWEVAQVPATFDDGSITPASQAGISVGDRIWFVEGEDTRDWPDFIDAVRSRPNQTVSASVQRSGTTIEDLQQVDRLEVVELAIARHPLTGEGRVGIAAKAANDYETVALPLAFVNAGKEIGNITWLSLYSIGKIFSNVGELADRVISLPNDPSANENLETRPLSVVGVVGFSSSGLFDTATDRLMLFAYFNLFLGVFNMLPLMVLDGGHLAVATYERWRERGGRPRHRVDHRRLAPITYVTFTLLLLIGVGLLYLDIANPVDFTDLQR